MATINQLRFQLGIPIPFKEILSTVRYSFPDWEMKVATHDKYELEVFLRSFNWALQDFVKEYSKITTKA